LNSPEPGLFGNVFEVRVRAKQRGGALFTEAGKSRNPVGAVTGERELIRHARWSKAAHGPKRRFVDGLLSHSIDHDHPFFAQALPEILVRRHDAHLFDFRSEAPSRGCKRIVRLVFTKQSRK
jgi:hypothetical protein